MGPHKNAHISGVGTLCGAVKSMGPAGGPPPLELYQVLEPSSRFQPSPARHGLLPVFPCIALSSSRSTDLSTASILSDVACCRVSNSMSMRSCRR